MESASGFVRREHPPAVTKWETVAFDVVVPSLGELRVSVTDRTSASEPLGPSLTPSDAHHLFDGSMVVHPLRRIHVRVSFESWRGVVPAPQLPAWTVSLARIDSGPAYAGVMLVVIDDQAATGPGGRIDGRAPIPIEAASTAGFSAERTVIGQTLSRKVGEEIALARWAWSPQLQATGMIDALKPTARLMGASGWQRPEDCPHPTFALRVRFTPSAKP